MRYVVGIEWSDGFVSEEKFSTMAQAADYLYKEARAAETAAADLAADRLPDMTYCEGYGMDCRPLRPATITKATISIREER